MAAMTSLISTFIFLLLLRIGSAKSQRHYHAYQSESDSHGDSHSHHHPRPHSHHSHESHAHSQSSNSKLLSKLSRSPLVLIVSPEALAGSHEQSSNENLDLLRAGVDNIMSQKPKDDDVYHLYSALRSAQTEHLDDKTYQTVESAKQVLQEKLVARCGQKRKCKKACLKVKNANNCSSGCTQVFDENDLCNPSKPKTTTEPPCDSCIYGQPPCNKKNDNCGKGRTMPPNWLRSLLGY